MTPDERRESLAAIGADSHTKRLGPDWPDAPWELSCGDRIWAVATDGHVLVVVPRASVSGDCAAIPSKVADLATKLLGHQPVAPVEIPASDLSRFVGGLPRFELCKACHNKRVIQCDECEGEGAGECECVSCGDVHDRTCQRCNGKGEVCCRECSEDGDCLPATFLGHPVDRRKLGAALAAMAPTGSVSVSVEAYSVHKQVYVLRSDDALALVMPMAAHVTASVCFDQPETWPRSGAVGGRATDATPR